MTTEERPALVLLDLGGTTVKDRGEVPAAFGEALSEEGVAFTGDELSSWRGASKRDVVRRLLARDGAPVVEDRVERVYRRFQLGLETRLATADERSLPGIADALERLRAAGIRVGVTTGFDRTIVDRLLGSVSWGGELDVVVCSDDASQGRPAPFLIFRAMELAGVGSVHRVAVVGDTVLDLEAGWNAGVAWRIGVLTGAHDRATLARGPFTHLLPTAAAVPDLWLGEPAR